MIDRSHHRCGCSSAGLLGFADAWTSSGLTCQCAAAQVPAYALLCFATVVVTTPLTCALLPQRLPLPARWLERDVQEAVRRRHDGADDHRGDTCVYVNKGL